MTLIILATCSRSFRSWSAAREMSRRHGEYCPTAGLRRDVLMVQSGVDQVLAFLDPTSKTRGAFRTADMAEAAGIATVRYQGGEA